MNFGLEPVLVAMMHATFVPTHAQPLTHTLAVANFVRVNGAQSYTGTPDECLTAA
jgi:hypothetical protein